MAKRLTLIIGTLLGIGLLLFSVRAINQRREAKSFSPEEKVRYTKGDLTLSVTYNRPYKKNREIFGGLVPYNELWRTGANEATVFINTEDILINGQKLKSGRHHLITIPREDRWTIIFNADIPGWGINLETGKAYRNVREDELVFDVPVMQQSEIIEQFTISIAEASPGLAMKLRWDDVLVMVPISEI